MHEEIKTAPIGDLPPPNRFPDRPERYPFSLTLDFVAGQEDIKSHPGLQPAVMLRPDHIISNVRAPGILFLQAMQLGNIQVLIGDEMDLVCAPNRDDGLLGAQMSCPWISPANRIGMSIKYNGRLAPGMKKGDPFTVAVTLIGEAAIEPFHYESLGSHREDEKKRHEQIFQHIAEREGTEERRHKELLAAIASIK